MGWEEDDGIFGGHIFGRSLQLGEFSYPSNDYFTEKMEGTINPKALQQMNVFNVLYYLARRGRENLQTMDKDTFEMVENIMIKFTKFKTWAKSEIENVK